MALYVCGSYAGKLVQNIGVRLKTGMKPEGLIFLDNTIVMIYLFICLFLMSQSQLIE